ncbi:hypothetical protein H6F89_27505 [Cyanobacteria bacterium FACHB-63]|nr:hypothetical protein [Cyanobacteria bacterium FACHB-63]
MSQFWMLGLGLTIVVRLSDRAIAQVMPDQSLPVGERSQVSGDVNFQIDGGATRGSDLFHSFQLARDRGNGDARQRAGERSQSGG